MEVVSVSSTIATIVVVSGLPEFVLPGRSDHLRHFATRAWELRQLEALATETIDAPPNHFLEVIVRQALTKLFDYLLHWHGSPKTS